jgi:hypothetical protein
MKRFRRSENSGHLSSVKHQIGDRETTESMILCFHELQAIAILPLTLLWSMMLLTSLYLLTLLIWLTPSNSTKSIIINCPNVFIIPSDLANFVESRQSKIKFRRHMLSDIEIFWTEFLSSFVFLDHVDLISSVLITRYFTDYMLLSYSFSSDFQQW